MISFFFSQVKSWTATRQNCYSRISWSILLVSFSLGNLNYRSLRFHSPSDRDWRKEVERRPFNWHRRSNRARSLARSLNVFIKRQDETRSSSDRRRRQVTHSEWRRRGKSRISAAQYHARRDTSRRGHVVRKQSLMFAGVPFSCLICRCLLGMDKVLVDLIKNEREGEGEKTKTFWVNHRMASIPPSASLGRIESLSLGKSSLFHWSGCRMDQTADIFLIVVQPCSFEHNRIPIKIWRCCLPPIRSSEHTLQRTLTLLCNLEPFSPSLC